MEITEMKIVEIGTDIEIRVTINNIFKFYTKYRFETEEQARKTLEYYGMQETNKRKEI